MSQNYSSRLAIVLGVLAIALVAIFWPAVVSPLKVGFNTSVPFADKINLRAGIDIKGGTSLLYEIKAPEGATNVANLAQEVVKALKQRIDPNGVMNLVWRPQGNTRIEIQMPLSGASGETLKLQKDLDQAREQLAATNVRVSDATDAVEGKNGKTDADLDKMATGSPERRKILDNMKAAWAQMRQAEAKNDVPAGAAAKELYDKLQQDLAATNLPVSTVEEKLALRNSDFRTQQLNALDAQWKNFPARAQALATYRAAKDRLNAIARTGGSLESAADLKRLLRGSGVLEYHMLPATTDPDLGAGGYRTWVERLQKEGPILHQGDKYKWFEVENPDEFKGQSVQYGDRTYVLASIKREDSLDRNSGDWALKAAYPTSEQSGTNAVGFEFNTAGADKFGRLTGSHVNQFMAIMLDGRTLSAPRINSPITGGTGIITGGGNGFTTGEMNYLVRMLSAGSLPAQLNDEPISERTVGPQLGEDNLRAGMVACGLGLAVVAVFLVGYYYLAGAVAFGAILMNIVLILGSMAAIHATFTLPGIAAIVLTIGTAVDANVLVFERLREEQHRGLGLRMALRNAYDRAFSAIVDSNMTTVITSFFLILFGTEEVKGFGITLIIGIICSLFTALFVTRTVFGMLIDHGGVRQLGSVPLSFPKWDKLLKPHIDWMGLAWIFYVFSAILIVSGIGLFFHYVNAKQMMDIEFASGTAVTFELKQPEKQEKVREWIESESHRQQSAGHDVLPSPNVQRVGPEGTTWEVTTPNAEAKTVRGAVIHALGEHLKAEPQSTFQLQGKDVREAMEKQAPDKPVIIPLTGDNLNPKPDDRKWPSHSVPPEARKYAGGAALVLRDLDPPLTPNEITARVKRQILQAQTQSQAQAGNEQSAAAARAFTVVAADGAPGDRPTATAIVLTSDPNLPYDNGKATDKEKEDQQALWRDNLAGPLWSLVNDAVGKPAELQQVKNFDASVAGDTQRDALVALTLSIIAIMAYIWIRFGNLKYGTATVVALLHDVLFTIAALGFAHLLANNWFGDLLKLEPFRINLTVVAGILTIMGYSMIDTIVVFDRIRENRGKYGHVSRQVINDAVNQTLSRTLLTAGTTIIMVCIMYFLGGAGIHGFTFVLLIGILVGTYSSVAIAAPILLLGNEATREVPGSARPAARVQTIGPKTSTTA